MKNLFLLLAIPLLLVSFLANAQTVSLTGSLNTARWFHQSQLLYNGKVLAFGGNNCDFNNEIVFSSAELYNPTTQTWSNTGSMNATRTNFASVVLNNGNVLAMGGSDQNDNILASVEMYQVSNGTWQTMANLQTPRVNLSAVKLQDGRILVAGYGKKSELYDPEVNTWTYTGDMNLDHGSGMATILLDDGQVLATGGDNALIKAELFNPLTGQWTLLAANMVRNHFHHKIIRLADGTFFLSGTQTMSTSDQLCAEIYNPSSKTFYNLPNMLTNIGISPIVQMDDGKILVYGMGDVFNPTSVKSLQLFNPYTYSWSALPYNYIGNNVATGHKLQNGKIILIGGSFTTGNGASSACLLIDQSNFSACVPPNLTLSINGNQTCNGNTASVTLPNAENGVSYQINISGQPVGSYYVGTGASLPFTIPGNLLIPGENIINITAAKPGCPVYFLNDTAIVNVASSGIPRPVITPDGATTICSGSSVTLNAPAGMTNYLWSTGATTSSISVSAAGFYRVKVKNGTGCYSSYSDPLQVSVNPTTISAGPNETVCDSRPAFTLTGFSPAGGTWSGTGVSPSGVFDPSASGVGVFTLTYSYCNQNASKTITVPTSKVAPFTLVPTMDSICVPGNTNITIPNSMVGAYYSFMISNNVISTKSGTGNAIFFNTGTLFSATEFSVRAIYYNACKNDTVIKKQFINLKNDPYLPINTKASIVCKGHSGTVYIARSQPNINYQLVLNSQNVGAPGIGNGDTLFIDTGILETATRFKVFVSGRGCPSIEMNQQVNFTINGPSAYFTTPNYNPEIGESIPILNSSINPGGTFLWDFGSNASSPFSSAQNPADITYSNPGSKTLKLICTSTIGCKDSISQTINPTPPSASGTCDYSIAISGSSQFSPAAVAYDQNDNSYLFTDPGTSYLIEYSNNGDTLKKTFTDLYSYNYINTLTKYDPKGKTQWMAYIRHNSTWAEYGDITTDSLGNVYCAFYCGSYGNSISIYSTNGKITTFNPTGDGNATTDLMLIMKFDKNGILQWHTTYEEVYNLNKVAITLDKNLNLYTTSGTQLNKYSINGQLLWSLNNGYIDIKFDSKGNLLGLKREDLVVDKYDINGNFISNTPVPSRQGTTFLYPLYMRLDSKDNLYIGGRFIGTFIFNGQSQSNPYNNGTADYDQFVCKINSSGGQEWIKRIKANDFVWMNGFDLKKDKIVFMAGSSYNTSIFYNPIVNNGTSLDTLSMGIANYFVCLSDTSNGPLQIRTVNSGLLQSTNSPYNLISFSKASDKLALAFRLPSGNTFDQPITAITIDANQINSVVLRYTLDCIFPPLTPISRFGTSGAVCKGTAIQFVDLSKNNATNWTWSFPGGIPSSSSLKNPIVQYNTIGAHTVSLTTSNLNGVGNTVTTGITVGDTPVLTVSPDHVCAGANIALSASGATSYLWENSATTSSTVFYSITQDTIITVTGENNFGCKTSLDHLVTTTALPVISFTAGYPTQVCYNTVSISLPIANPSGGTFSGNGVSGTQFYPMNAGTGIQTITYDYTDPNGCSNSASKDIEVYLPELTVLSGFPSNICNNASPINLPVVSPAGGVYSGNGLNNGMFDPSLVPLPNLGEITYTYTDGNGCSNTSVHYIYVDFCTNTKQALSGNGLKIFPNPCAGKFTIESDTPLNEAGTLSIMTVDGKTVLKEKFSSTLNNKEIDLSSFSKGIYHLQLITESGIITNKTILIY